MFFLPFLLLHHLHNPDFLLGGLGAPALCSTLPLSLCPVLQAPALGPTHLGIQFLGFLSQLLLPHYLLLFLAGFILLFCFLRTKKDGVCVYKDGVCVLRVCVCVCVLRMCVFKDGVCVC